MNARSILALIAATLALPALADQQIDVRKPAKADGVVDISNVAGTVEVVGWDRDEVHVTGTHGEGVERFEFEVRGDHTTVRVELPRNQRNHRDADADLTIRVPRGSRVVASTVSASIDAKGLAGRPELRSVSGDVAVAGSFTAAELQSVSGRVTVGGTGDGARIRATAVSGDVRIERMHGELSASAISGDVRVTSPGVTRASLSSVSGEVLYDGALADRGVYELSTVSGEARLVVHGTPKATYDLESAVGGDIRNAFGPKPVRASEYGPGRVLRFSEGEGAEVRMDSVSGALVLDRK